MRRTILFVLVMAFPLWLLAQSKVVTGKIKSSEDGSSLPGVNVVVKGTTNGTISDANGNYSLEVGDGEILVFSFVGMVSQEVQISGRSVIDISMASDVTQLSEIVVTGAGGIEARRKEMGYNATTVQSSLLTQAKPVNVASGLIGKVAGLQINTVSSGVNPNVRVVLRGNRSITGNNQALVVVDNIIVPNTVLSTLNPEDIDELTVLNGPNAAALYGSDASNGALLITTKKGRRGGFDIKLSNTTNLERVSFYPEMQTSFGSGFAGGYPTQYVPYENQQYGPRFDGSIRPIGKPLEDGRIQEIPYSPRDDKKKFWETGVTNQTDLAISGGDDRSSTYFSVQYLTNKGTTPKDEYTRASIRLNGTRDYGKKLRFAYTANYVQNRYDITTATASIYDQLLQTPSQIPLTQYKDWKNDPFANPNGYYNEYYDNPYWTIDNERQDRREDNLTGNIELKYSPVNWLDFTYRLGISSRTQSFKNFSGQFILSDYTKSISPSKTDVFGAVADGSNYINQLIQDFFVQARKEITSDISFNGVLGSQIRTNESKFVSVGANGLVIPELYNVSNRVGEPTASESNFKARQVGLYGQIRFGFRDFLFLEATGRNDWVSTLSKDNRSFFYPAVSASFVATDAFEALRFGGFVETLKIRGGWSKVGQVNLGNSNTFGAYSLQSTFSPTAGFPYGSLSGYSVDNRLVSSDLRPEITSSIEGGIDFGLWDSRISGSVTLYDTRTVDQTIATGVSTATGYSTYLQNTGETSNKGIEVTLNAVALRTQSGLEVAVGGNYTYNENKVISISGDLPRLQLSTGAQAQVYAIEGENFPVLVGNTYNRDSQGRIIVDRVTGYPSAAADQKVFGNTVPKHRLGLTGELRFKGIRFNMLWEYRGDYQILYNGGNLFDFSGSAITTAYYNRERFVIPNSSYEDPNNDGSYIPNTSVTVTDGGAGYWTDGSFRTNIADNYIISGDYWKLRELVITYDFPRSLLSKTKVIKAASLSLQGRNLFIFTPKSNIYTDPDYNFTDTNAIGIVSLAATPPTRFYGATISLTF